MLLASCKTQYEQIRTSNDPKRMLTAADKYYEDGSYIKAISLYELLIPSYRGQDEAEQLFYNFAYAHYNTGQYILASHYFKNFSTTYYNSEHREETSFMSAFSKYKMSPNHKLDQSGSEEAIDDFQTFLNKYPNSERVAQCNEIIEEIRGKMELKAYDQGKLYYKQNQFESAIQSFENMLKDFPESKKSEEVRFLIAKSSFEFAANSIYEKRRERYTLVLEKCKQFKKKFPKSKYSKNISKFSATAEKKLKKYEDGRSKKSS